MPTKREREYYRMGFRDGRQFQDKEADLSYMQGPVEYFQEELLRQPAPQSFKPKRKLSAWNKYVKANSKKPRFRYRDGKLNLKKMAVAFRKTPAGKKKRR
jgi:hypothetical protein